ncbi:uncharacterized protein LOC131309509 [Rhododendron vialii]|uniref:uncharacterized protein LOC131309509 n=1 Tax=Rhododendron vialii TaxID=182163 RepID=UPI00265FBF0B|nr:uncharacterized protein LOC131309509 [Rhododendron vialii]
MGKSQPYVDLMVFSFSFTRSSSKCSFCSHNPTRLGGFSSTFRSRCQCCEGGKRNAHHNEDRLMQFLMGLNATYNPIQGQILLLKPVPDIREAYNMVTQDDKQREIGNNSLAENSSVAAAVRFHKGFNPNNKSSSNSSFSSSTSNTEGLFCRYCKKDTHAIKSCYKLHGFPVGHPRHDPNFKPKYDPNFKPPSNRPGQQHQQYGARSNPAATHAAFPNDAMLTLSGLSAEQYQQLTAAVANAPHLSKGNNDVYANVAGLGYGEDDWLG